MCSTSCLKSVFNWNLFWTMELMFPHDPWKFLFTVWWWPKPSGWQLTFSCRICSTNSVAFLVLSGIIWPMFKKSICSKYILGPLKLRMSICPLPLMYFRGNMNRIHCAGIWTLLTLLLEVLGMQVHPGGSGQYPTIPHRQSDIQDLSSRSLTHHDLIVIFLALLQRHAY